MCLDLWTYPDGSCNLVATIAANGVAEEFVFPCAPHQLVAVLRGKPMVVESENGSVTIERCDQSVCAQLTSPKGLPEIRQCLKVEAYRSAVEALVVGAVGFLA